MNSLGCSVVNRRVESVVALGTLCPVSRIGKISSRSRAIRHWPGVIGQHRSPHDFSEPEFSVFVPCRVWKLLPNKNLQHCAAFMGLLFYKTANVPCKNDTLRAGSGVASGFFLGSKIPSSKSRDPWSSRRSSWTSCSRSSCPEDFLSVSFLCWLKTVRALAVSSACFIALDFTLKSCLNRSVQMIAIASDIDRHLMGMTWDD